MIALSKDWFSLFDDIPRFEVKIKGNRLVLSSQKITKGDKVK